MEFDDYQRSCSLAYDVINRVIEVKGWSAPPQKRGLILRFLASIGFFVADEHGITSAHWSSLESAFLSWGIFRYKFSRVRGEKGNRSLHWCCRKWNGKKWIKDKNIGDVANEQEILGSFQEKSPIRVGDSAMSVTITKTVVADGGFSHEEKTVYGASVSPSDLKILTVLEAGDASGRTTMANISLQSMSAQEAANEVKGNAAYDNEEDQD